MEHFKLECLKLACQNNEYPEIVVKRARLYHDFIYGKNDAEIICAAHVLSDAINRIS